MKYQKISPEIIKKINHNKNYYHIGYNNFNEWVFYPKHLLSTLTTELKQDKSFNINWSLVNYRIENLADGSQAYYLIEKKAVTEEDETKKAKKKLKKKVSVPSWEIDD